MFILVILVVSVGIGKTMDAGSAAAIDIHPESTVGVEQSLGAGNVYVQFLNLRLLTTHVDPI